MNIKSIENTVSKAFSNNKMVSALTDSRNKNVGNTERWITSAGGALLTWYGFQKKGLTGKAVSAVGTSLLARGVSGFCPVNNMLGKNKEEQKQASAESTNEKTPSMEAV